VIAETGERLVEAIGGRGKAYLVEKNAGEAIAAEQLPEFLPPGEPVPQNRPLWMISDDIGTRYVPRGGSSSGTQSHRRSTYEWESAVPPEARVLYVVGPGMQDDEPLSVPLR